MSPTRIAAGVLTNNPRVRPNTDGLPGLGEAKQIVGALLTWGLVGCVAALAISAAVWAISAQGGNIHGTSKGKTGVLVSAVAAILIGGANAIITFFSNVGDRI
jgi:hypothetical protein